VACSDETEPREAAEQILSYPPDLTTWQHPDDPPPWLKVVRLWRFADTDLRRVDEPRKGAS
jgi:hypothetical protein